MKATIHNMHHMLRHKIISQHIAQHGPEYGNGNGLVVGDIDYTFRYYGPRYGTDNIGKFWLCETKWHLAGQLSYGQQIMLQQIDTALSTMPANRYLGCWRLDYRCDDDDTNLEFLRLTRLFKPANPKEHVGHDAVWQAICTGEL